MTAPLSLVADIGGTNCRLALARGSELLTGSHWQAPLAEFGSFTEALEAYLADKEPPVQGCIAAAGPVQGGEIKLTNAGWHIKASDLPMERAYLLNDLQALGYALAPLGKPDSAKLVVNLGTGLNTAVWQPIGPQGFVPQSEAGYMRLPHLPDDAARQAVEACAQDFGANCAEAVLSGRGLERLHHVLSGQRKSAETLSAKWPQDTLTHMLTLLGHHVGDLALAHLPYGGIWLTGGLGCALAPHVHKPAFAGAFGTRGPYTPLMERFEIKVLDSPEAALKGAALYLHGQTARA